MGCVEDLVGRAAGDDGARAPGRSARRTTDEISGMSCSMIRMLQPVSNLIRWSSGPSSSVSRWATPDDGSSSRSTFGSVPSTQARSTRRRVPVDSSRTNLSRNGAEVRAASMSRSTRLRSLRLGLAHVRAGAGRPERGAAHREVAVEGDERCSPRRVSAGNRRASWNERWSPSRARSSGAEVGDVVAEQRGSRPSSGVDEAGDEVEQRRLAGAVRADEPEDLALARATRSTPSSGVTPPKRLARRRATSSTTSASSLASGALARAARAAPPSRRRRRRGTPSAGCRCAAAARRSGR